MVFQHHIKLFILFLSSSFVSAIHLSVFCLVLRMLKEKSKPILQSKSNVIKKIIHSEIYISNPNKLKVFFILFFFIIFFFFYSFFEFRYWRGFFPLICVFHISFFALFWIPTCRMNCIAELCMCRILLKQWNLYHFSLVFVLALALCGWQSGSSAVFTYIYIVCIKRYTCWLSAWSHAF